MLAAVPVLARQRLTPVEYSNVKSQLRARGAGGWARVDWALARRPALHELELLHARLLALNPKARTSAIRSCLIRTCSCTTSEIAFFPWPCLPCQGSSGCKSSIGLIQCMHSDSLLGILSAMEAHYQPWKPDLMAELFRQAADCMHAGIIITVL